MHHAQKQALATSMGTPRVASWLPAWLSSGASARLSSRVMSGKPVKKGAAARGGRGGRVSGGKRGAGRGWKHGGGSGGGGGRQRRQAGRAAAAAASLKLSMRTEEVIGGEATAGEGQGHCCGVWAREVLSGGFGAPWQACVASFRSV